NTMRTARSRTSVGYFGAVLRFALSMFSISSFSQELRSPENPVRFTPQGVLRYMHSLRDFGAALANPSLPPEMPEFVELKARYLRIFEQVFDEQRLDALVFPQMRCELPPLHGNDTIQETTVGEINIAGLPGIAVPAGYYESGAPFGLIFVGRQWDEAALLGLAFAYESGGAVRRKAPALD
ncbi:amidase family protein, partial [Caballeronia sp. RCC_10]|uniref:amidase family protein n=1 Tax=Caballeronia sp. RCC_10 TaxID=3239227 RepID=UPI003524F734